MNTLSLLDKLARLSSPQLAQVEQFISAFASPLPSQPRCDCHIIDPSKNTILIFPCSDPKHSDSLIVKISGQKFIAPPRKDKNGVKYWKARDFYEEQKEIETQTSTLENDLVKSYQAKVEQKRPIGEFSMAEIKAHSKWTAEQEKAQVSPNSPEPKLAPAPEQTELQSNESSFDNERQIKENATH